MSVLRRTSALKSVVARAARTKAEDLGVTFAEPGADNWAKIRHIQNKGIEMDIVHHDEIPEYERVNLIPLYWHFLKHF